MAEESTYALCQDGRFEVKICLFTNVRNAEEVKKKVLKGQIQAAAVRPSMISESLKNFGIQDADTNLLLICIYEKAVGNNVESYFKEVDGTKCQMEELPCFTDVNTLKQLYKVTEEELKIGTLSDAIVCRIATKDVS